jgi:hypothetical protein
VVPIWPRNQPHRGWRTRRTFAKLLAKGTIVTTGALNCQRAIAQQVVDQGGDCAPALKGNQGTLHADVTLFLDDATCAGGATAQTVDADHGRIESDFVACQSACL